MCLGGWTSSDSPLALKIFKTITHFLLFRFCLPWSYCSHLHSVYILAISITQIAISAINQGSYETSKRSVKKCAWNLKLMGSETAQLHLWNLTEIRHQFQTITCIESKSLKFLIKIFEPPPTSSLLFLQQRQSICTQGIVASYKIYL